MLSTKNIIVQKHARIFLSKPVNQEDEVWILFHGYAQNMNDFYNLFTNKEFTRRCFIIPEGLSRFYQKGISGNVGASWMTKEERDLEIIDQQNYLNQIIEHFNLNSRQINIFAFSQGATTAARWISESDLNIKKLIFWSGNIPNQILSNKQHILWNYHPHFFIGKEDQFTSKATWARFTNQLNQNMFTFYEGDHFFTPKLIANYVL